MSNKLAIPKQLTQTKTSGPVAEIIYTSPAQGAGTIISAVTISNDSSDERLFRVWIGNVATVDDDGPVMPDTSVKPKRADNGAELIGQIIPAGHSLWVEDPFNVLLFTISGRELIP